MRLLAALLLCVVGLSGSTAETSPMAGPPPHDAYIWQRLWTPKVVAAAAQSANLIARWHLLVGEAAASGHWTAVAVPWTEIRGTDRPIVAVIRIDGRLDEARMPALLDRIAATVASAPALAGLEIDYDCPTSKLAGYARFLAALRQRLPSGLALSITALPTWMSSPALERVAAELGEIVLQVHAVDDPRHGLFDPVQAERWVRDFGRRIPGPFRVALPAYDVRVTWRADGKLASVEGERKLLTGHDDGETLGADPKAVLDLIHSLERAAPVGLRGFVWFRLPTTADVRAWSLDTWRAVITGHLPPARLDAALVPTDSPNLWDVTLINEGQVDVSLPRQVRLDPGCEAADGANGFHLASVHTDTAHLLALDGPKDGGRLRAHGKRVIGWARCSQPQRQLDVAQ